jgi:hypothetical protein
LERGKQGLKIIMGHKDIITKLLINVNRESVIVIMYYSSPSDPLHTCVHINNYITSATTIRADAKTAPPITETPGAEDTSSAGADVGAEDTSSAGAEDTSSARKHTSASFTFKLVLRQFVACGGGRGNMSGLMTTVSPMPMTECAFCEQ